MLSGPVSLFFVVSQALNSPATLTAVGAAPWNVKTVPHARCGMMPPSPVVGDAAVVAAGADARHVVHALPSGRSGTCRNRRPCRHWRPREGARENETSFGTYRSSVGVVTRFRVSCQARVAKMVSNQRIRARAASQARRGVRRSGRAAAFRQPPAEHAAASATR